MPIRDRSLLHDLWMVSLCGMVLSLLLVAVFVPSHAPQTSVGLPRAVGQLIAAFHDVRRRTDGALVWNAMHQGDTVHDGDGIYVGPGGAATVQLASGAKLSIDDRSMIIVRPVQETESELELLAGSLVADGAPIHIHTLQGGIRVASGHAQVQLHDNDSLAVSMAGGRATLRMQDGSTTNVEAGQRRLTQDRHMGPSQALGPDLLAPADAARLYSEQEGASVRFAWAAAPAAQAYILEIAPTAEFAAGTLTERTRQTFVQTSHLGLGTYHWRVRTEHPDAVSESRQLSLLRDTPPALLMPRPHAWISLVQPGAQALLSWADMPDAAGYLVEIRDPNGQSVQLSAASATLRLEARHFAEGESCYRVRVAAASRSTPFSELRCFRVEKKAPLKAPMLFAPQPSPVEHGSLWWRLLGGVAQASEETSLPRPLMLRWETIEGAAAYVVEVASDAAFSHVVLRERVAQTTLRWQPPATQDYFWRVHAIDSDGRDGELSEPQPLLLVGAAPELLGPGDDSQLKGVNEVVFLWQGHGPSRDFWVELSKDAQCATLLRSERVTDSLTWTLHAPPPEFYWRVVQRLEGGQRGLASEVRHVTLVGRGAPPDGLQPHHGEPLVFTSGMQVPLRWNGRASLSPSYEVQWGRDKALRHPMVQTSSQNCVNLAVKDLGAFYWRVRSRGPTSDWSAVASFGVALATPAVQVKGATLSWDSVAGATQYQLAMEHNGQVISIKLDASSRTYEVGAQGAGTYVLTLQALNGENRSSVSVPQSIGVAALVAGPALVPGDYVGVRLGLYTDLQAVTRFLPGIDLTWRHLWGAHAVGASLRVGLYVSQQKATSADHVVSLAAHLVAVPVDILVQYLLPTPYLDVSCGVGLRAAAGFAALDVTQEPTVQQAGFTLGGLISAGAERGVGPGMVFVDLTYALTASPWGFVAFSARGLSAGLGYRLKIF